MEQANKYPINVDQAQGLVIGDYNIVTQQFLTGIAALPTDYANRIQNFLTFYLRATPFGGREAEMAHLKIWLDDVQPPPYMLLVAPAGRGKSALLVHWSQRLLRENNLAIAFLPVSIGFNTNLGSVVFAALTARLASLHGEQVPGTANTPTEVWRGLMTDYLTRSLPDGRRLLLILDGVDEAADWKAGPDLFPLVPPKGVKIIVSARYLAGDADARQWLSRLKWDRGKLAQVLELKPLTFEGVSNVLLHAGLQGDVAVELFRLSEGDPLLIRLYMDDLLEQERTANHLYLKGLEMIRPGLKGYFDTWWEDQRNLWGDKSPLREPTVQALLNLLACALGPLTREDVFRLAPREVGLNNWSLGETLLPMKRFILGDGRQQGYAFSHPRLREYFYEQLTPDDRHAIESRFLDWGVETLKAVNEGRLMPEQASSYIVQYYGVHLKRSGHNAQALLSLVSDGWRQIWERFEGAYAGFLNDTLIAWQAVEQEDAEEIAAGRLAPYLGDEVRCALCRVSINSLTENISVALLRNLVKEGIWTVAQGLVYAHRMLDKDERAKAFTGLVPLVPEPLKGEILVEALGAVRIMRLWDLEETLADLAAYLPEPMLQEALKLVQTIPYDGSRASVLSGLVPHLPEPLVVKALEIARAIHDAEIRAWALTKLAPFLPEQSKLKVEVLREALKAAQAISSDGPRAEALAGLARFLPEPLNKEVVREVLKIVRSTKVWVGSRAKSLTLVAPMLSEPQKAKAVQEAFEAVKVLEFSFRLEALTNLAPFLSEPLLREALTIAQASTYGSNRLEMLLSLMPFLPGSLQEEMSQEAQKAVEGIAYGRDAAQARAKLAASLPDQYKSARAVQMLETARAIKERRYRAEALLNLVPFLPEPLQDEVLREGLQAAPIIGEYRYWARALTSLVDNYPKSLKVEVLREALKAAQAIYDAEGRAWALTKLAPFLPEQSKLKVEVEIQKSVQTIKEDRSSYQATPDLPLLPPELADELQDAVQGPDLRADLSLFARAVAMKNAQEIKDESLKVEKLMKVGSSLPERLKGEVLVEALRTAQGVEDEVTRSRLMTKLAPALATLPPAILYSFWRETLHSAAQHTRQGFLVDLAALGPIIISLGGSDAVAAMCDSIMEVGNWWP